MSFFKKLFRNTAPLSEEGQRDLAVSLLKEAEAAAPCNPAQALATLARNSKPAYDLLRIGGAMHGELRAFVERNWLRLGTGKHVPSSTVEVICWAAWEYPTVRDLSQWAAKAQAEILYLAPPPKRNPRDAIAELEALSLFVAPDTAMVTVGEEGMFFRRSFIVEAGKVLSIESEEIGQDMLDQAKALGLKTGMIVA